jgi:hypothetical protein
VAERLPSRPSANNQRQPATTASSWPSFFLPRYQSRARASTFSPSLAAGAVPTQATRTDTLASLRRRCLGWPSNSSRTMLVNR